MKSTPEKYCKYCGKRLERKRYGKRLEDMGVFKKRKYCDRDCMRKGWINTEADNQNYSNSHSTARKSQSVIFEENCLRDLWEEWEIRCSSQGYELAKQYSREFNDYMQKLPQQDSQTKKEVYDLWCANEGIGILRETLPKIQEIWGSLSSEAKSNLQDLWNIRPCKGLLCETLSGNEKKTSFRIRKLCR